MRLICLILIFIFLFSGQAYSLSLTDVHKDYIQGNYKRAIRKAHRLPENDESLYFLGLAYIKIENYPRAKLYLRKLVRRFPDSKYYDHAMARLADTYFLKQEYKEAEILYKEIVKRTYNPDNMPLILLRLAQISSRQGKWEKKRKYLQVIKDKFPQSSEMKFVKILEGYGDFFTIQVGAFSEKKNALGLAKELKRKKYKVYVVRDTKGIYPIYKVRVEKFRDRNSAQNVSVKLRRQGYPARIYP
ncbi:MAG: SPOR domain-containing protein [Omnitrophica bacterium]|nr:SPOR domain-containing protein [Candidatus Omnitrophota bacterium]